MSKIANAVNVALTHGPNHQVKKDVKVDEENIQNNLVSKTWDDMDKIYNDLAGLLANNSESFKTLMDLSANELKDFITDEERAELNIIYNGYVSDLNCICNDMLKVKKSYEKFTGKPRSEKETLMSISVLESYISIHDKILAIFPPTSIRAAEIVGEATNRRDQSLSHKGEVNV